MRDDLVWFVLVVPSRRLVSYSFVLRVQHRVYINIALVLRVSKKGSEGLEKLLQGQVKEVEQGKEVDQGKEMEQGKEHGLQNEENMDTDKEEVEDMNTINKKTEIKTNMINVNNDDVLQNADLTETSEKFKNLTETENNYKVININAIIESTLSIEDDNNLDQCEPKHDQLLIKTEYLYESQENDNELGTKNSITKWEPKTVYDTNVSDQSVFECNMCGRIMKTLIIWKRHMREVCNNMEKKYKCEKCAYKTNREGEFKKHTKKNVHWRTEKVNIQSIDWKLRCSKCAFRTQRQSAFQKHLNRNVHSYIEIDYDNVNLCELCDYSSIKNSVFKRHIFDNHKVPVFPTKHGRREPWSCLDCGREYFEKRGLEKHMTHQHSKGPFTCKRCGTTLKDNFDLTNHRKGCFFKCTSTNCGYSTTRRSHLESHMNGQHKEGKKTQCAVVGCFFTHRKNICVRLHSERHQKKIEQLKNPDQPKYMCKMGTCGFSTNVIVDYKLHYTSHPELAKKIFSCPECDFMAFKSTDLKTHISAHDNIKITCAKCKQVFKDSIFLHKHKPCIVQQVYDCTFENCEYKTQKISRLKDHEKRRHMAREDKEFKALLETYTQKVHLSGFECDRCDFSSDKTDDLNSHKRFEHNMTKI